MSENEDEFLTVNEIAGRLKLNPQTLRNWIDEGRLPAVRVGRRVRIRRTDFEQLVQQGYSGPTNRNSPVQTKGPSADDFWSGETINNVQPPQSDDEPKGST